MLIWVRPCSRLLDTALSLLISGAGFRSTVKPVAPRESAVALCNYHGMSPPFPPPASMPTLALIDGGDDAKIDLLRAGYRGYLGPSSSVEEIRKAIVVVARGDIWAERHIVDRMFLQPRAPALTVREREALQHLAAGLTNKELAVRLGVSVSTAKSHVSNLLVKLEAKNRMELIARYRH